MIFMVLTSGHRSYEGVLLLFLFPLSLSLTLLASLCLSIYLAARSGGECAMVSASAGESRGAEDFWDFPNSATRCATCSPSSVKLLNAANAPSGWHTTGSQGPARHAKSMGQVGPRQTRREGSSAGWGLCLQVLAGCSPRVGSAKELLALVGKSRRAGLPFGRRLAALHAEVGAEQGVLADAARP